MFLLEVSEDVGALEGQLLESTPESQGRLMLSVQAGSQQGNVL